MIKTLIPLLCAVSVSALAQITTPHSDAANVPYPGNLNTNQPGVVD